MHPNAYALGAIALWASLATAQAQAGNSATNPQASLPYGAKDDKPVTKGWIVQDGTICRESSGGDIFTEREYANFILEFEWKVPPKTNSGVKYRVTAYGGNMLGPEYQVLDDEKGGEHDPKKLAQSLLRIYYDRDHIVPVNGAALEHDIATALAQVDA